MLHEGKREFVEPQLIKCEEPLDRVTMFIANNYGCHEDCNEED